MRLVSWNVNGVRAVLRRGFLGFLGGCGADVVCLQETRAGPEDLGGVVWPSGFLRFWCVSGRRGYSGTAVFSRVEPLGVRLGLGRDELDGEGRVVCLEFGDFFLVNVYTPNSGGGLGRLGYRVGVWDVAFREFVVGLQGVKPVVFCGDLNVAHREVDLARPRENVGCAGFTVEERESFGRLLGAGFVDSFRVFESGGGHYSWWSYRGGARARNVGWRLDYFCVGLGLRDRLRGAWIWSDVLGSDHCPVVLELG